MDTYRDMRKRKKKQLYRKEKKIYFKLKTRYLLKEKFIRFIFLSSLYQSEFTDK